MQFLERPDTVERKRNYLLSKPYYNNTKSFTENLFAIEIEKTQILLNKSIYIRLSKLELSTIVMQEFWYDYVKSKYGEKAKLYIIWINTVSLYTQEKIMFKDIPEDAETWFDTSNYELLRLLPNTA